MNTPPITGVGIVTNKAPNFPRTANKIIVRAPQITTTRLATWSIIQTQRLKTRRSENYSTLGRPRLENANICWAWPFQILISFLIHCIMPQFTSLLIWIDFPWTWSKALRIKSKVPADVQKFPSMTILKSDLRHDTVHHSTKCQSNSWYP